MKNLAAYTAISMLLLTGCVNMKPLMVPPTINLSPEELTLISSTNADRQGVDFGLSVRSNESDSLANVEKLPGIKVTRVQPNGPADLAGVQANDVILTMGEINTNDPDVLARLAQVTEPNIEILATIRRGTTVLEASFVPRSIKNSKPIRELYRVDPVLTRAAYVTEILHPQQQNQRQSARVVNIDSHSPLLQAGIKTGDLIVAVDEITVSSAQELITRLNRLHSPGSKVRFTVVSGDRSFKTDVTLWKPQAYMHSARLFPLFGYQNNKQENRVKFHLIDIFPIYEYRRSDEEVRHRILWFFTFRTRYSATQDID